MIQIKALAKRAGSRTSGRLTLLARWGAASILVTWLASCGNSNQLEPIGIGPDRDELKRSPCACVELQQMYPLGTRT